MSEYPWNEKNNTFTWLSSLYNPFKYVRKIFLTTLLSLWYAHVRLAITPIVHKALKPKGDQKSFRRDLVQVASMKAHNKVSRPGPSFAILDEVR